MSEMKQQELANMAWAFAMACRSDAPLFGALSSAAKQRTDEFNAQNFANVAWAFAEVGRSDAPLFVVLRSATE